MALYLIGLGLGDEQDITLKGLQAMKKCTKVYLESYTSHLCQYSIPSLERLYGKKIIVATREMVEDQESQLLQEAQKYDVALLIPGSPLSATTHMELVVAARRKNIPLQIIENASIFTAIAQTGLFLYKFGRAATIPFEKKHPEKPYEVQQDISKPAPTFETEAISSPYQVYVENQKRGWHTLFLLDVEGEKMMTVREGLDYLLKKGMQKKTTVIGCGALGSNQPEIRVGAADTLRLAKLPQCLIIPGKLNFKEEEALEQYTPKFFKNLQRK